MAASPSRSSGLPHIGLIVLALLVLGALGFGAVRLSGRRRPGGAWRAGREGDGWVGASAPGGPASAEIVRDNPLAGSPQDERIAPSRAVRAVVSPGADGWAVETHGRVGRGHGS